MVGKCLPDFCSPPWPIDELGFSLLNAVFLSGQCSFGKVDPTKWRCDILVCKQSVSLHYISRGLQMHPKEPAFTVRLRFQSLNLLVMMVFLCMHVTAQSQSCRRTGAASATWSGWDVLWQLRCRTANVRSQTAYAHVDTAAERTLGSVSPVDCVEFRQTCTCSQDEKHVGALGGVGVSNTSDPQVHWPEPSQNEVSGVELKIIHCSDREGFPGNVHREQHLKMLPKWQFYFSFNLIGSPGAHVIDRHASADHRNSVSLWCNKSLGAILF